MSFWDRLGAMGRGAGQAASAGWNDELVPKLLSAMPVEDETGIPREYAGGQENQYRNQMRAENAEAARKYPANYGLGAVLGGAPAAIATGGIGAGIPGAVALGGLAGGGFSENTGAELARDVVRGGAVGGALGAAGNAVAGAVPVARDALSKLRQGGPPSGGFQPAYARVGAPPSPAPTQAPNPGVQINRAEEIRPPRREAVLPPAPSNLPPTRVPKGAEDAVEAKLVRRVEDEELVPVPYRKGKYADTQMAPPMPDAGPTARPPRRPDPFEELRTIRAPRPKAEAPAPAGAERAAMQRLQQMREAGTPQLGEGYTRAVFDEGGRAVKVAKKPAGIVQNRSEAELSGRNSVINPVLEYAPDYSWVKQPKVQPFEYPEDMARQLGLPEDENWLRQMVEGKYAGELTPAAQEFQSRLGRVLKDVPELDTRDLGKAAQWGMTPEGKIVLLDYGFRTGMPLGFAGAAGWELANQNKK